MSEKETSHLHSESTKDKNLDKVMWFKIFLSVIIGLVFGLLNFTGFISFAIYFIISVVLSTLFFNKFVTQEDVDYQHEIFIEGLNVSIPTFILVWTITYTLNKILISNTSNQTEL